MHMADSLWCTKETNTVKQLYPNKDLLKKIVGGRQSFTIKYDVSEGLFLDALYFKFFIEEAPFYS